MLQIWKCDHSIPAQSYHQFPVTQYWVWTKYLVDYQHACEYSPTIVWYLSHPSPSPSIPWIFSWYNQKQCWLLVHLEISQEAISGFSEVHLNILHISNIPRCAFKYSQYFQYPHNAHFQHLVHTAKEKCTAQTENIFNFNIDVRTLKFWLFILISERYFTSWCFCEISKDDFSSAPNPTEPLPFPFCSLIHRLFGCRSDLLCIQSLFHFHFLMQEFNCSNPSSLIHLLFRCPSAFNSFCRL